MRPGLPTERQNMLPHHPSLRLRRGVAMLLILVALAAATIMASAYLASRDNSGAIGDNAAAVAEARWASLSGVELARAVLETENDWRAAHTGGRLLEDFVVGAAALDIDIVDLETDLPPTAETKRVQITATATIDGVSQTSTAHATVLPTEADRSADVDLAEFAVFTAGVVDVSGGTTIASWSSSPAAGLGGRLAIGTQGTAALTIDVRESAALLDATVYLPPGASGLAVDPGASDGLQVVNLGATLPMPAPAAPPAEPLLELGSQRIETAASLAGDMTWNALQVTTPDGMLTVSGPSVLAVRGAMRIDDSATIRIHGDTTLVIGGDLLMTVGSAIELADGATLTVHVGGAIAIDGAYVGNARPAGEGLDPSGRASYLDPLRLRILENGAVPGDWQFTGTTVVKASVYAPSRRIEIAGTAALHGRVAGAQLTLTEDASLYYDPNLLTPFGYTNASSPLWDGAALDAAVAGLAALSPAALGSLADALGVPVTADCLTVQPSGAKGDVAVVDPDARTVAVLLEIIAVGSPCASWEKRAIVRRDVKDGAVIARTTPLLGADLASIATTIRGLDEGYYLGEDSATRLASREALASALDGAAAAAMGDKPSSALARCWEVLSYLDGESGTMDLMGRCAEKSALVEDLLLLIKVLTSNTDASGGAMIGRGPETGAPSGIVASGAACAV